MESDGTSKGQEDILKQMTINIRSTTKSIRIKDETIRLEECPICGDLHISDLEICTDTQESILECEKQIEEEDREDKYVNENFEYNYSDKFYLIFLLITICLAVVVYNVHFFVHSKITNGYLACSVEAIIIICVSILSWTIFRACINKLTSKYQKAKYDFRDEYRKNKKANLKNQETA